MNPTKPLIFTILFIALLFFIWHASLKPMFINEKINLADRYARTEKCEKALDLMESDVIHSKSVIDSYAKLKHITIIERCQSPITNETIKLLKEVSEIRPYYTRTWILLGSYTGDTKYLDKALKLSPNHEEIFVSKIKINFAKKEYSLAQENANECIKKNPDSKHCWWLKTLSSYYLENIDQANQDLAKTISLGFGAYSNVSLLALEEACQKTNNNKCYQKMFEIYKEILPSHNGVESFDEYKERLINYAKKVNKLKELNQYFKNHGYN